MASPKVLTLGKDQINFGFSLTYSYLCPLVKKDYSSYLEFLRWCLDASAPLPTSVDEMDWADLYRFARRQTVEATYWEGIERLDQSHKLLLTETEVLTWMARVKKIERRNKLVYEKAAWVWNNFRREGFRSCVLKGQGNALLYPTPYMRTPGDIDIWVEGGDDKVISYVNNIVSGKKVTYHHIEFLKAGKVSVEVHYRPSWMSHPVHNKRLQDWFLAHADACFSNEKKDWGFCVPTFEFNVIFLLSHIYTHLIREGVGLRHVVDYYHLLQGHPHHPRPSEEELRRLGLRHVAGALMWVLNNTLGLPDDLLICQPDERRGRVLLGEILKGGNFGKHDDRAFGGSTKNSVRSNMRVTTRDLRLLFQYPSECVTEPWFRVWHYFWRRKHQP